MVIRQNTNYKIVRYAAHPFFLQVYTLCANCENTFYTQNMEFQKNLHRGYIGFESDSQNFLYTLHYVLHQLKWENTEKDIYPNEREVVVIDNDLKVIRWKQ